MFALICYLVCIFVALGTGVLAGVSDFKRMTIPNIYSVVIGGAFIVCFSVLSLFGNNEIFSSFLSHFLAAGIVLGLTAILFAVKAIGAGDSKLATVFALWVGLKGLVPFLFCMSVFGGGLGVMAILLGKFKLFQSPQAESWIAHVQAGESKVPYGIAIAAGALVSFVNLGYFDGEVLSSFLSP